MIQLTRKDDVSPICPHCDAPVEECWYRQIKGTFGQRYLYFCSSCRKVLGISHRKGFWMG